jgi:hypothetical protein
MFVLSHNAFIIEYIADKETGIYLKVIFDMSIDNSGYGYRYSNSL